MRSGRCSASFESASWDQHTEPKYTVCFPLIALTAYSWPPPCIMAISLWVGLVC